MHYSATDIRVKASSNMVSNSCHAASSTKNIAMPEHYGNGRTVPKAMDDFIVNNEM
jgi:hypothetical protein